MRAEIYRWVDADGHVHFTSELSSVPPEHRVRVGEEAVQRAQKAGPPTRYQRYSNPAESKSEPLPASLDAESDSAQVYRVNVQRAGTHMLVEVRLNGSVSAPFIIDTGASDVVIPRALADELGLRPGRDARTQLYHTANGVIEAPVVNLDSVELGGAAVRGVPASINESMRVGLLGLSFFNHFTYQIDAAAGVVTLRPNDLVESGLIRGGRSEEQWRAEYQSLRQRMAMLEAELARTPSSRGRKRREFNENKEELRQQYRLLETEADSARVPMNWRE